MTKVADIGTDPCRPSQWHNEALAVSISGAWLIRSMSDPASSHMQSFTLCSRCPLPAADLWVFLVHSVLLLCVERSHNTSCKFS